MTNNQSPVTTHQSLSIVLATKNEEANISECLESIKEIADEIIIFDENSTDNTIKLAKKYGAKVTKYTNKTNFHETKQKAIDTATGEWILQLDADERVTKELANEIREVIGLSNNELATRKPETDKQYKLFQRHQELIEKRDGKLGNISGEIVAFFIPRRNFFLGKPLIHARVYPDGVIRLFKKGKARLPGKSVHEVMEVDGEVRWLLNDLEHHDSPTLTRYLDRMNRYTDLQSDEFIRKNVPVNALYLLLYSLYKPAIIFLKLYFRYRGFSDGMRGFIWSVFSALHYPVAYFKYYALMNQNTNPV